MDELHSQGVGSSQPSKNTEEKKGWRKSGTCGGQSARHKRDGEEWYVGNGDWGIGLCGTKLNARVARGFAHRN